MSATTVPRAIAVNPLAAGLAARCQRDRAPDRA